MFEAFSPLSFLLYNAIASFISIVHQSHVVDKQLYFFKN